MNFLLSESSNLQNSRKKNHIWHKSEFVEGTSIFLMKEKSDKTFTKAIQPHLLSH